LRTLEHFVGRTGLHYSSLRHYEDRVARAGLIVARPIANDRTTLTMVALRRRQARVNSNVREMIQLLRNYAESQSAQLSRGS
jgi:hypothetical protein